MHLGGAHWCSGASEKVSRLVDDGVPPELREEVWRVMVGDQVSVDAQETARLFELAKETHAGTEMEETMRRIDADIPRTCPQLALFRPNGPMEQPLRHILTAFVLYRPDIGYVQGMSYIGAMILLNMDTLEGAFHVLINVLCRQRYACLFNLEEDTVCVSLLLIGVDSAPFTRV